MWGKLREVLNHRDGSPEVTSGERRRMATAVLLLEIARADFDQHCMEAEVIASMLRRDFGLDEAQTQALLADAGERLDHTVSLHEQVAALNDQLSADEKRQMMGYIWQVAYADGELDPQEEARARYLAELLYIPHEDFIRQKLAHEPAG